MDANDVEAQAQSAVVAIDTICSDCHNRATC